MRAILSTYLLAATFASTLFIVAGYWRKRFGVPIAVALGDDQRAQPLDRTAADVRAAAMAALKCLQPILLAHATRIDVGINPGLLVRLPADVLADMLEDLLTTMIRQDCQTRLLLTAAARGSQISVMLTDTMPDGDEAELRAVFRGLAERVALRGGALDIAARGTEGRSVTLRLAAAMPRPGNDMSNGTHEPSAGARTTALLTS